MDEINTSDLQSMFFALDDTPADLKVDASTLSSPAEEIQPTYVDEDGNEFFGEMFEDDNPFGEGFDFDNGFAGEEGFVSPEEAEEATEEDDEENVEGSEDGDTTPNEEGDTPDEPVVYDELDVDYDTVLTLPDGRDVTIEELANGYMAGETLTGREEAIRELAKQFEERVEGMRESIELCILESDGVIDFYKDFEWEKLAAEDREAYVENMQYLNQHQKRRKELQNAFDKIQADKQAKEDQARMEQNQRCVETLKKEIPNWNDALYEQLLTYAANNGADEQALAKENRPEYFTMLYKAYQYDNGKAQVMAKIKKAGSPKKVLKGATATDNRANAGKDMAKARAVKAAQEGKLSHSDMFKYLSN